MNGFTQSETLRTRVDNDVVYIQIHRPEANNAINEKLIQDFWTVLDSVESTAKIIVIEGSPEVFCFGADFNAIKNNLNSTSHPIAQDPGPMYSLWHRLATGPFVSIAHVRGKANAGGIGFVAACDLVLAESAAVFSLSELLFGLMPACVLPFLIRRIGPAKANFMSLTTQPVSAQQAHNWGLVDALEENSEQLVRRNIMRLSKLNKTAIRRYKKYMSVIDTSILDSERPAIAANLDVFSDPENLAKIKRFVNTGRFPWESDL